MSPATLWQLAGSAANGLRGERRPSAIETEVSALFAELRPPLLRYLRGMGLPIADGEDVAQETFLSLFDHLRQGKPRDNLRGWIFRVGHNLALKRMLRNGREGGAPLDGLAQLRCADTAHNPEEHAAWNARRARLLAIVRALPERERRCLSLRAEGLRYREIAEAMEMSLGAVAASLSRTLGKLASTERS